ncbi:DUF4079 family protein [Desulfovibrio sp. Huiquan2017]|uniref:DUF4079 family protein n=1 Tax=Desulfovibrio sp. Huiquan2017 TaxID=2816861 RepID=UPI001A932ABE|nr:DUF4079 family protein [Desulfovibrio sp. Huiquan2017]
MLLALYFLLPSAPAVAADPAQEITPCLSCHTVERICRNIDQGGEFWTSTVRRMIDKGAHVGPDQVPGLVRLLSGPNRAAALGCPPDNPETEAAAISIAPRMAHPLLMGLTLLLALWVARQGVNRARFTLFRHKVAFNWKGHTRLGLTVMVLWLLGMTAGTVMTILVHGTPGVYGIHRSVALFMLPLILFGAASGLYMDRRKAPRTTLPLLHGAINMVLVLLALGQLITGTAIVARILAP